jgi:hypothetical protein
MYSYHFRGLGVKNMIQFNFALWGSGCGGLLRSERLCRERWWALNMIVRGEVGVLGRLGEPMGWGCGKA